MKKMILVLMLLYFNQNTIAQQLEWYETLNAKGPLNQLFYPNNQINVHGVKGKIVVSSRTCSKSLGVEGTGQIIFDGSNNNPDPYFVSFNDKGEIENSQIILTPNNDGVDAFISIVHNPFNGFIYCSFQTASDSIKFSNTTPWQKINKKDRFTITSFLIIYDNNYNYVTSYPFYSFNGCMLNEVHVDKQGNIYTGGFYKDSLNYEGKLLLKNKSIYGSYFFMKLNINNKVEWVNDGLTGIRYLNESRSSIYQVMGLDKSRYSIIYNSLDSIVFPATNYFKTIVAEFSTTTGQVKQYTTINSGAYGLAPIQLKGNDNTLILNASLSGIGNSKIKIGSDSFSYVLGLTNNFINGFNASNLQHKFINFFDSVHYKLRITDIYNDSLYSITGETRGNQNFGFKGGNIFAKDYLKGRPVNLTSDFLATYTNSNRLKDLWYLTTHPNSQFSSFENSAFIFSNNGDIYLAASIPYHSELGLGNRTFNYTSGNRALTLLKYSCKPTAYYSYTKEGNKVNFKNQSTGLINYKWLFGNNNDFANTKDAMYEYPKSGGVFYPRLIASNACGNDTFTMDVTITPTSINASGSIKFNIYPNPANSKISIQFEKDKGLNYLHFTIYDISGKKIICPVYKIDETNYEMDIVNLNNGIYLLVIQNNNQNISQRITILK